MLTCNVLSRLVSYPETGMIAALPFLRQVLRDEKLVPVEQITGLERLMASLEAGDLIDLQTDYVSLFDRSRNLSLHLFEHVHGDSRDRGQALVSLHELYQSHGLEVTARETPDYLPLILEFLSICPETVAREMLGQMRPILAVLAERLAARKSGYAAIVQAILCLDYDQAAAAGPAQIRGEDDESLESLDEAWEEEAVSFGPGAAQASCATSSCSSAHQFNPIAAAGGSHG